MSALDRALPSKTAHKYCDLHCHSHKQFATEPLSFLPTSLTVLIL